MIAVASLFLAETTRGSIDSLHESAVNAYLNAKCPFYATRTTLWICEVFKERQAFQDAALSYIRMSKEVFLWLTKGRESQIGIVI